MGKEEERGRGSLIVPITSSPFPTSGFSELHTKAHAFRLLIGCSPFDWRQPVNSQTLPFTAQGSRIHSWIPHQEADEKLEDGFQQERRAGQEEEWRGWTGG